MKNFPLPIITISLLLVMLPVNILLAADIPIEVYVEGGLTIEQNGDWGSGLSFGEIQEGASNTLNWNMSEEIDYIDFADDTASEGFYITIDMIDFSDGETNTIPASNFKLFGEYENETPSAITKGENDSSKNLSILPNSCETIGPSNFDFHNDFLDSQKDYSITLSNSPQTLISSNANCLAIGHLRFDHAELNISENTPAGTYASTITITIIDGTP